MGAYDYLDEAVPGLVVGMPQNTSGWMFVADSTAIQYGDPVMGYVGEDEKAYSFYLDTVKLVFDADFVTGNLVDLKVNTVAITQVPFNTNHNTTAGDLVTAIGALTGVECTLDPADASNRTFLIRTKGTTCLVTDVAVTGGASQAGDTQTTDSGQVYLGIARFSQKADGEYQQGESINILTEGEIWVKAGVAVNSNDDAYIYNVAGADVGKWYGSGTKIDGIYKTSGATDALVVMRTKGQTKMTYAGAF